MSAQVPRTPLIAIVDDHRDVRTTIGRALERHGFRYHPFASGEDLLEALQYLEPDCILLDFRMPSLDGLATLKAVPERARHIPVIFFTSHGDVALAVEAMKSGAADFIEKPSSFPRIIEAIERAIATRPAAAEQSLTAKEARALVSSLTAREEEIMRLACDGNSSKEIAEQLDLSVRTVESHRYHAIQKLGCTKLVSIARIFGAAGKV